MKLEIFAIRDAKAEAFLQPFFMQNAGAALRAFGDSVNDEKCPFNKHPEDYAIYSVGSFDDSTGEIVSCQLSRLGGASEYIRTQE